MRKVMGRRVYARQILSGLEPNEMCFSDMLRRLPLTRGTLSTTLKEMQKAGLVKKSAYGRNRYYYITQRGRRELDVADSDISVEERMASLLYGEVRSDMRTLRKQCGVFVRMLQENKEITAPEIENKTKLARHLL